MLPNQIFILGGGASVRYLGAIDKGLFSFLQDKFVIGLNYSYKFVNTTCTLGIDENVYEGIGEGDPIVAEEISKLPLVIWKQNNTITHPKDNTIFLTPSKRYDRDLQGGVYRASLSGIFALSLAVKLMDLGQQNSEVYLLGYDYGPLKVDGKIMYDRFAKPFTHWYQDDFKHRGTGKISWFQQTGLDMETRFRLAYSNLEFRPFATEKKVKIYNVGGTSNIPHFEQISYETFFTKKLIAVNNQDNLRTELKEVLWKIKNEQKI